MQLSWLKHKFRSIVRSDSSEARPLAARPIPKSTPIQLQHAKTMPELAFDSKLMERLLAAYRAAQEHAKGADVPGVEVDMWDMILEQEMQPFKSAVEAGDTRAMYDYLSNIGREYVWFGGLSLGVDGYTPRHWTADQVVELYWEKMVSLGEACGALCIENPESGPYQCNFRLAPDEVLAKLEAQLGVSLTPPDDVLPTFGLKIGSSVYHYRHINAIYAAQMMTRLVPDAGRVAEIGGGLGLLALYARRMKRLEYSIYDLPISGIISGFFLLHSLGPEQVCLFGEEGQKAAVHIKPFWTLADIPTSSLDMIVNQDGLNEVDLATVEFLIRHTERATKSYFLSLNHETFGNDRRVSSYVRQFTGMTRLWRSKTWVREGYVDELYECRK